MFTPRHSIVVAGRYELVREIGRGGMGSVWEANDLELRAPCALKFILEQAAALPEMRSRFLREARGVAKLQSPHVVNIRSVGEHDDALFIAMELLHGETLRQRLERERTLNPNDTLTLVQQVAAVLTVAHESGIVHRDLKPENIWLWSNPDLFVKVIDFGVAKHLSDGESSLRTATGALVGTPRYMSPEQAAGDKSVDHRSDLWSLALIAAECLSGRPAFDGAGLRQVLITIILGPVPSMADMYVGATPELEAWWRHATANRAHRFQSAHELVQAFAAALTARAPLEPTLLAMPVSEWSTAKRPGFAPTDVTLPPPKAAPAYEAPEAIISPPDKRRRAGLWMAAAITLVAGALAALSTFVETPTPAGQEAHLPAQGADPEVVTVLSHPKSESAPPLHHTADETGLPVGPSDEAPMVAATAATPTTPHVTPLLSTKKSVDPDAVYRPLETETPGSKASFKALPSRRTGAPERESEIPVDVETSPSRSVAPDSPPPVDTRIGF